MKIIWTSTVFPEFTVTDLQLKLWQRDFPSLPPFEPILREIERYVVGHPDKLPATTAAWNTYVDNWLKREVTFRAERAAKKSAAPSARQYNPGAGRAARTEGDLVADKALTNGIKPIRDSLIDALGLRNESDSSNTNTEGNNNGQ